MARTAKTRSAPVTDRYSRETALLREKLGEAVVTTQEARFAASLDSARLSFLPDAVVKPRNDADIAALLELANAHRVPVVPRGAGSATTGAASPVKGGWVLDLTGWKGIEIDRTASMAYVEAGAVTGDVNKQAEAVGLFYPPDPSSLKHSTIGGNIATNAGGLRAAKYGVTRDYVYALEGFLPTGEKVRWGADVRKYKSGYNVRDLWVGSEGTLGVITRAVLKLIPKPAARHTLLAAFRDDEAALAAVLDLLARGVVPSILEFIDSQTIACTEAYHGRSIFPDHAGSPLLLLEVDGHPAAVAEERAAIEAWAKERALDLRQSADPEEAEALWHVRRTCSQAMFTLGDTKLNEDIVVPRRSYLDLIRYTLELKAKTGLATPSFGHAADGNFHVHLMYHRDRPEEVRKAEWGLQLLMEKVVSLGGVITGEHGIGLSKSAFLKLQHAPAEIRAMRALKRAFDPRGIMNPGKIFQPFPVWKHPQVQVKLPWDKH